MVAKKAAKANAKDKSKVMIITTKVQTLSTAREVRNLTRELLGGTCTVKSCKVEVENKR